MLLGKLPTKTGVFSNDAAIPGTSATFLHSLVAEGYETVLIGRMHFKGIDQRHGFTKRLVGDFSTATWNRPSGKIEAERGVHLGTAEPWCLDIMGGGDSPILEYDKAVVKGALEYLKQDHDKPQCIFVSTYGPHFPYVAPVDKYLHYKDRIEIPDSFRNVPEYLNPVLQSKIIDVPDEKLIQARAAYFGMIETIDEHIGTIKKAFDTYLEKQGRKGVFTYISDHGDQAGDRKLFGKTTFFENSARIPLIMEGENIAKGNRITTPVSIMDLGPTLCELAGTKPPPAQDGKSLVRELSGNEDDTERAVLSELINTIYPKMPLKIEDAIKVLMSAKKQKEELPTYISRMVRRGKYKYMTYIGLEEYDLLFDLEADPDEKNNIASEYPEIVNELRDIALKDWNPEAVIKNHKNYVENVRLVKIWEKVVGAEDIERWKDNPEYARGIPKVQ
jgi:choline-sulfatase